MPDIPENSVTAQASPAARLPDPLSGPSGAPSTSARTSSHARSFVPGPSGYRILGANDRAGAAEGRSPGLPRRPVAPRFMLVHAGWDDLTRAAAESGPRASVAEVVRRLRRYSLREVLSIVARLTIVLDRQDPAAVQAVQRRILTKLLSPAETIRLLARARAALPTPDAEGRVVFFHERQVLTLLKLALLAVDADAPDQGVPLGQLVEALLMVNDLLDTPMVGVDPSTPEGQAQLEAYVFANVLFNAHGHPVPDLVRTHALYVAPPPAVVANGRFDLAGALTRTLGMAPDVALHALSFLTATWVTASEAEVDAGAVVLDRRTYFSTLGGLTEPDARAWFALGTAEVEDLQARVRRAYSLEDPRYFDVLEFERTPLVAVGDDVFCASLPLLRRLASTAFQHRLLDPQVFSEDERRQFLNLRGHLAEHYVVALLRRAFGERCIGEAELQAAAGGAKVCDALVVDGDAAMLFEVKAAHAPLAARHAEHPGRRQESRRALMRRAADQLESTAALIARGALLSLGVDPAVVRRVYPVVVTPEQPVTTLSYRAVVVDDLRPHPLTGRGNRGEAAMPTLMDVYDLEALEVAVEHGASAADLLRRKMEDHEYVELSFDHFLRAIGHPSVGQHSRWHAAQYEALTTESIALLEELRDATLQPAANADIGQGEGKPA